MQIADTYSYRHAEAILEKEYPTEKSEIEHAIQQVEWQPKSKTKVRERQGRIVARLDIDQIQTNVAFVQQFDAMGWAQHPLIVSGAESKLAADFKKGDIQVEVQFGNMARWYTDVFKFLLSYAADDIEVGVLLIAMQDTAKRIDENVVYYERIVRELPHAKMAITIPVWVVGVK